MMMAKPMEEIITNTPTKAANTSTATSNKPQPSTPLERRAIRPQKGLNCPRCSSTNTKFCYYNNYSLTQPRYFCKTCKRYWTQGGSLRNIPIGGKIRKNKIRLQSSSSSRTAATKVKLPSNNHDYLVDHPSINQLNHPHHAQDLNLGNNNNNLTSNLLHLPDINNVDPHDQTLNSSNNNTSYLSAFLPMHISNPNPVYPFGFPFQGDLNPTLIQGAHESVSFGGRIDLFPFENLRSTTTTTTTVTTTVDSKAPYDHHHQDHISDQLITRDIHHQNEDSTGYWTGDIY